LIGYRYDCFARQFLETFLKLRFGAFCRVVKFEPRCDSGQASAHRLKVDDLFSNRRFSVLFDGQAFAQFPGRRGLEYRFGDTPKVSDPIAAVSGGWFGFRVAHTFLFTTVSVEAGRTESVREVDE